MTWRYDVFACPNETDDHNACVAWGAAPIGILGGDRWKDAFRKAETLPHGVVTRTYTGNLGWTTKTMTVFERIEGGGICWFCGKGRGPLCKTGEGNRFICVPCQVLSRRMHEQNSRAYGIDPDRWVYVPIIDTLDWKAQ